jgi:hypothetical protein
VICLLEDPEVRDLGLELEAPRAREAGLRFERFPIPDRAVPASAANARALWIDLADRLRAGRGVGIHCRAGIGRSSLMAAGVLREIGVSEDHVWTLIASARGWAVPDTPGAAGVVERDQDSFAIAWILRFGERIRTRGPAPDQLILRGQSLKEGIAIRAIERISSPTADTSLRRLRHGRAFNLV